MNLPLANKVTEIDSSSHCRNDTLEAGHQRESFKVRYLGSKKQIGAVAIGPSLLSRFDVPDAAFLPSKSNYSLQRLPSRTRKLKVFSLSRRETLIYEKTLLFGHSSETVSYPQLLIQLVAVLPRDSGSVPRTDFPLAMFHRSRETAALHPLVLW